MSKINYDKLVYYDIWFSVTCKSNDKRSMPRLKSNIDKRGGKTATVRPIRRLITHETMKQK